MALPATYRKFTKDYPDVFAAYDALGAAVRAAGPLDERTAELVKLALNVGALHEGGTHSAVRKCLKVGVAPDEIRHVVMLAIPTVGFPGAQAARTWVEDLLETPEKKT
jgi:4-carboxymuconolactone decarboxylase